MFDQLSISPYYDLGDGAEVLLAHAGQSRAIYIDGEMVFSYDEMNTGILMDVVAEHTNGNLGGYREAKALYNGNGTSLYNDPLPENPTDIIFSDEVEIVTLQDAEDLRENLQYSTKNHVVVRIRAGIIDEQMVQEYASDSFFRKIIEIQNCA